MTNNPHRQPERSAGDRERFTKLYSDHALALLGYALRRTSREDAVDLVADTFTVAWRRLEDLPKGDHARPWLFGVARNVLSNQRRTRRRRDALVQRIVDAVSIAVPVDAAVSDDELAVREALTLLDPLDQELLTLTCWEGLSPTEVATALDMPAGTVRSRLHRARKALKNTIGTTRPVAPAPSRGEIRQ